MSFPGSLKIKYPKIAAEWHSAKNKPSALESFTYASHKIVWWKCKKRHEWPAMIKNRTISRSGCPYCSGRRASPDNCLQTVKPLIAEEWHSTKNRPYTPIDVPAGSHKKAVWVCRKKRSHVWEAEVRTRVKGRGCPYCSGRYVCYDNCLQTVNPALAGQWHPTKNKKLTPRDLIAGSHKMAWWKCRKGHEWPATIKNRNNGSGCPDCHPQTSLMQLRIYAEIKHIFKRVNPRQKIKGKEIDVYIPALKFGIEYDGTYYHKLKHRRDRKKNANFSSEGIFLLRVRGVGLPKISTYDIICRKKAIDIRIIKRILQVIRRKRAGIIKRKNMEQKIKKYLDRDRFANKREYEKRRTNISLPCTENSLYYNNRKLVSEWHPTKNYPLTPKDVPVFSNQEVYWRCRKGHEWLATIANRSAGKGCPYCSGNKVCKDNCLKTLNPSLANEWYYKRNKRLMLTPYLVTVSSGKKVWWKCRNGHKWPATINSRNNGRGCPNCR